MADEIITEQTVEQSPVIEEKPEECPSCKLNIGAAMMITVCRELAEKDPDFGMDCKTMENELTEKEEAAAPEIIEKIYNKVMEKGNEQDKEVVTEIRDLSYGKIPVEEGT